nr:hypothetical protein [Candidatus Freyarchaeota archaeon]
MAEEIAGLPKVLQRRTSKLLGGGEVLLGKHTLQSKFSLELVIHDSTGRLKRVNERASQTQ